MMPGSQKINQITAGFSPIRWWTVVWLIWSLAALPACAQSEETEPSAPPRDRWTIIPEGKIQLEYDTNALQLPGFGEDTIAKLFVGAVATYDFPSDTQLLSQYQLQVWRYANLPIYNVMLHIGTLLVSQKFDVLGLKVMDTISPFFGGQVVYKEPTTQGVSRVDFNVLAGFSATKTFGSDKLLVGGYQFANLLAEVPQTAYSAHGINVLYRMGLLREIILSTGYQLQLRLPWEPGIAKNLRNTLSLGFQFLPVPGLSINLNGDYTYEYAGPLRSRIDYFSLGISLGSNLIFTLP